MKKNQIFLSENFQFLVVKSSVYLNRHVFVIFLRDVESGVTNYLGVKKRLCLR